MTSPPQLLAALPDNLDAESQHAVRAVLRIVLEPICDAEALDPVEPNPLNCPNCDATTASTRTPYCGERCKDTSSFIRQFRGASLDGRVLDPERQAGLGQALWHILGGGYPHRITLIPSSAIRKVIEREGGACQVCGGQATTVDHAKTACNRPINLRAVCAACSNVRSFGDAEILRNAEASIREISARIAAPQAVRICDDPAAWDWRAYLKARSIAQASLPRTATGM